MDATDETGPCAAVQHGQIMLTCRSLMMEFRHVRKPIGRRAELRAVWFGYWKTESSDGFRQIPIPKTVQLKRYTKQNISPFNFLQIRCSSWRQTESIRALKATHKAQNIQINVIHLSTQALQTQRTEQTCIQFTEHRWRQLQTDTVNPSGGNIAI